MAQLPPKIPTMAQNWPPFPHQTMSNYLSNATPTTAAAAMDNIPQPSWVDEFLDFTSVRRGAHRRSMSDSIAYLETAAMMPLAPECHRNKDDSNGNGNSNNIIISSSNNGLMSGNLGFDRLDDDQLMSMFADDMSLSLPPSSSNPSTPSDQNSNNEDKPMMVIEQQYQPQPPPPHQGRQQEQKQAKTEPEEVESSCKQESQQPPTSSNGDAIIDPRRVKRILANRQSAQRSRVRKLQYISELERSVTTLQTEVSALSPRVAFLDHQRLILNVDNSALKQRIAALAQDKIFKDAHQEALKKEIERLRQVYHQQQNLKKINNNNSNNNNKNAASLQQQVPQQPPDRETLHCVDK
uniref:BZIP domain-containing protein n=1 Tax=Rhizophora mucronata TaxID=61149 RepID=A0A2P2NLA7_RHIMU